MGLVYVTCPLLESTTAAGVWYTVADPIWVIPTNKAWTARIKNPNRTTCYNSGVLPIEGDIAT